MIRGLHHVTATVDGAQEDLDFYVGVLGLRHVKKTVNFDNPRVFHFYYGDEQGTPGTLMTTFPYGNQGVRRGTHGNGQISETRFSIPAGSGDYWARRIAESGSQPERGKTAFGEPSVATTDPSGLVIVLVECDDVRSPRSGPIDPTHAIRGIHSVSFPVEDADASIAFAESYLGLTSSAVQGASTRVAMGSGGPGSLIDIVSAPGADRGSNGLGTVHHVALAVKDDEDHLAVRERWVEAGVGVTEVKDRQYFRSIYFHEPGGVLYEVATLPPGFAVDEEPDALGEGLKLPPWVEPMRGLIEEELPPVTTPG